MRRPRTTKVAAVLAVVLAAVAAGPAAPASGDAAEPATALDTPPMGWQSFKKFQKDITEALIKQQADLMVSTGMRDAGYDLLIVDGGWRLPERHPVTKDMQVDRSKFPSGLKALGDYLHGKGLRFGLHQAVGERDCAGIDPGTQSLQDGEQQDADLFASWGVDVLKYDLCQYRYPADVTPGAPDLDELVLRRDGQVVGRYQAEAASNVITGAARVDGCGNCSGGKRVTALGLRDGTLTFPAVTAPAAGDYSLEIRYVNVDRSSTGIRTERRRQRMALLGVNGAAPVARFFPVPTQGTAEQTKVVGWGTVDSLSVPVRLQAGTNRLSFADPRSHEDEVRAAYQRMADALERTGRPIELHLSEYGMTRPWLWAPGMHEQGVIWRTEGDIADTWDGVVPPPGYEGQGQRGIMYVLDRQDGLQRYAGPGGWNDPNTIQAGIGEGNLNTTEYRTQFSLWAILAAPLLTALDLRTMTPEIKNTILNREVIAVDQDPLGVQGRKIRDSGQLEVWLKPLADGSRAAVLLNRSTSRATISVSAHQELGLPAAAAYRVRHLWSHTSSDSGDRISAEVPPHGVAMIRVRPAP